MSPGSILFVVLVALTLFSNGVQAYIHFEAYPLLSKVGKPDFAAYIADYEKRLTVPLLLPTGLTVLSNLVLIFVHPVSLSVIGVIVALLLNLAVPVTTATVAAPVYNRVKAAGQAAGEDMSQLMRINLLRLLLSTASSLVILALLITLLPA
jgi:hypothetical protein